MTATLALDRPPRDAAEAEIEVRIIEIAAGESLGADRAAFDGALLVLSDDPVHAADATLTGVLPL
ncbi:MAG: hypothetical protein J0I21_20095, partial [Alphaproteobacteria bacterium]|nr:hypothetical protein [Alphaproteobacteria bacterium]